MVVFKAHHVLFDGLGCAAFFMALSGRYDAKGLPCLKPLSIPFQIFIALINPLLTVYYSIVLLMLPP